MNRSVLVCMQRGFLSARANSGVIWMAVLQSFLVTVLFFLSLLPLVLVFGGTALLSDWSALGDFGDLGKVDAWLSSLPAQVEAHLGALAAGLVASLFLGMLVVVVWAWFQAGIVGILLTGERQAHPDAHLRAGGWRWFKTFTLSDFAGWGGRHLWRFFWFCHLVITAWMLVALVAVLLMAGLGAAWQSWGGGAATGLGCGGSIPLLFLFWVLAIWGLLAQPAVALPEPKGGTVHGSIFGFQVLGRRLGAASLLFLALLVATVLLILIVGTGRTILDLVLAGQWGLRMVVFVVSSLVQSLVAAAVNVWALASFAALVAADPEVRER
jgi:hypothetical protein